MKEARSNFAPRAAIWIVILAAAMLAVFVHSESQAITINVVDTDGIPVNGFRWLVEEDTTHPVTPYALVADSLALDFHNSYAPVVANGVEAGSSVSVTVDTAKRYAVSVLPLSGYTLGGANVAAGQTSVDVTVHAYPIPTAQISVFVFNDNNPLDNAPNIPVEAGLENFGIIISEQAGPIMQDAFGNPLGTTYQTDINGDFIIVDGAPQVDVMGNSIITTDANGEAVIKYIPPGKYGIVVIPPHGTDWVQTSTIEGTPTVDAWVKANEPPYLVEFAPAFHHVFIGFVQPLDILDTLPNPGATTATISGTFVNDHFSRPPIALSYPGAPVPECWVGLNTTAGQAVYAQPCGAEGNFTVMGVPPGTYQLVVWDTPLDYIFGFSTVIVPAEGGTISLGNVPVKAWFASLEGFVFTDFDQDGFKDPGELGIPDQAVQLRFRDGTIYQATVTDHMGEYALEEVFPFFHWLVVEVDFARFKATGATVVVDAGGPVPTDNGWNMPSDNKRNPQVQASVNPNTGNNLSRTETGEVLTEGVMLFAGEPSRIDWGKAGYAAGENGGISGVIFYAVTRAENDPRYAVGEEWEPGIPRVQVNLYTDSDLDGVIDDLDGDTLVTLADVDNHPFGWAEGTAPRGPEDIDRNDNTVFDPGDAISITTSDSWDDNKPTGCIDSQLTVHGQLTAECYDNLSTWNQIRPAVFDGGYAFGSYFPGGIASGSTEVEGLPNGMYIVEAVAPPGYQLLKEEDKNVDFGDEYVPSPLLLPPVCVGDDHLVPAELALFPGVPSAYAGMTRPLCDRKQVHLQTNKNAAADFFFFTDVPKAARAVGLVNNDIAATPSITGPSAGEKAPVPWIPISFRDFKGVEVARVYTDEFGKYNTLLPSTYTVNIPSPSGVALNMLQVCLNHPGPIEDPLNPGTFITDPQFVSGYSQTCYTLNFSPGRVTYLDTPVIPLAAFQVTAGVKLDCEQPDGTPVINQVNGPSTDGGPHVSGSGDILTITSLGLTTLPNPAFGPLTPAEPPTIQRDYSFGGVEGTVMVGSTTIPGANVTWAADGGSIEVTIPPGLSTGQLKITRGDNLKSTVLGVTLHVGGAVTYVDGGLGETIQDAIDAASSGELIIVKPGIYSENVILWKNVKLQGTGAYATTINAAIPPERLGTQVEDWRLLVNDLVSTAAIDLLPAQPTVDPFFNEEAPGVLVLGKDTPSGNTPLVDGFTIRGSITGGGVNVNAYVSGLQVSNNRILSNQGTFGGGIKVGNQTIAGCDTTPGCNSGLIVSNNEIRQNGGVTGGGGVSIYTGADGYSVSDNFICGNLSRRAGGGIFHYGLSKDGLISGNTIAFNEGFFTGTLGGNGGGIFVGGEAPVGGGLTAGSGSVTVDSNLIQGNLSGSGSGGGIMANNVNGLDVQNSVDPPNDWYSLDIYNNMVVNNVAAYQGGGVALADAARANVSNNTIANNQSTATSAEAFGGALVTSNPQGAGIVARAHSAALAAESGQTFTNPALEDNIVWHNQSFYFNSTLNGGLGALVPNATPYWDLQVFGTATAEIMDPQYCILTDTTGYAGTNLSSDPLFAQEYLNTLLLGSTADEGGTFVSITFSPLNVDAGDYHITASSPAIDAGTTTAATTDFDGDGRSAPYDIGADEFGAGAALFTLSVTLSGSGTVVSSPVGITCGVDCASDYVSGTNVTLSATPDAGFVFSGWSLGSCPGTGDCVVSMTANTSVTATFIAAGSLLGVFNNTNTWMLDTNGSGIFEAGVDATYTFGAAGFTAVTGDWNDDGKTEIGIYGSGTWYLDVNGDGIWNPASGDMTYKFGAAGYLPVTGDWNNDGITDIGIYGSGTWYLDANGDHVWNPASGDKLLKFGAAGYLPVTGDWNGDGTTDIGVFLDRFWYLDLSGNGAWGAGDASYTFGSVGDKPITGDWDSDGSTEIGVYRNGSWYLDAGGTTGAWDGCGTDGCYSFGGPSDTPVSGRW